VRDCIKTRFYIVDKDFIPKTGKYKHLGNAIDFLTKNVKKEECRRKWGELRERGYKVIMSTDEIVKLS